MRRHLLFALAAGLLFLAADRATADEAKTDADKIKGTWSAVARERDGQRMEVAEDNERHFKLVFDGKKIKYQPRNGSEEEGTYKLDATKKPKTLDLSVETGELKGKTLIGIYELDGDKLKICHGAPDSERPKEFGSKQGIGIIELKRVKP